MLIGALAAGASEWRREYREVSRDVLTDVAMQLLWAGLSRPTASRES